MNPALLIAAAWLLVIGYGLVYVGYQNQRGIKVSFQSAFFPAGLLGNFGTGSTSKSAQATTTPIQASGGSLVSTG